MNFAIFLLMFLNLGHTAYSIKQSVVNSNSFAIDLYKNLITDKDIIISPLSIRSSLSLIGMGAAGKTEKEIFDVLVQFSNKKAVAEKYQEYLYTLNKDDSIDVVNKIFIKQGVAIGKQFQGLAKTSYFSEIEDVNFEKSEQSVEKINKWVSDKTKDKINNLLPPDSIDSDTVMLLINAVYFKGTWETQFDASLTENAQFWLTQKNSVNVPMMSLKAKLNYLYDENLDADIVELKYQNSSISMVLFVPKKLEGLQSMKRQLFKESSENITNLLSSLQEDTVELQLPKFKVDYGLELKNVLQVLGLKQMFSDFADFSNMLEGREPLRVSSIVHKSFLEIDEKGTEAASATASQFVPRSFTDDAEVVCDRPFLFLLKMNDNRIIFIGEKKTF